MINYFDFKEILLCHTATFVRKCKELNFLLHTYSAVKHLLPDIFFAYLSHLNVVDKTYILKLHKDKPS